ncbi:MAG: hypothetical protein AAF564_06445 [Bacteroidota bacterium]
METILTITYLYMLVLLMALLIERVMEVIMTIWNVVEVRLQAHHFWNQRTETLMKRFAAQVESKRARNALHSLGLSRRIRQYTDIEQEIRPGQSIEFSSEAVRYAFVRTFAFFATSAMGIGLCLLADVNLIAIIKQALAPQSIPVLDALGEPLQHLVSGLVIGLGAEPVHRVIKGLEAARDWLDKRNRLNNALSESIQIRG